jgi:hypothetical protein
MWLRVCVDKYVHLKEEAMERSRGGEREMEINLQAAA